MSGIYEIDDLVLHNDDGEIIVVHGVGHPRAEMLELALERLVGDLIIPTRQGTVPIVMVQEGHWGWSPRVKHCEPYTEGWGCDQAGDWHRHYIPQSGGEAMTLLSISHWEEGAEPEDYDAWVARTFPPRPDREEDERV